MDKVRRFFANTLHLGGSSDAKEEVKVEKVSGAPDNLIIILIKSQICRLFQI